METHAVCMPDCSCKTNCGVDLGSREQHVDIIQDGQNRTPLHFYATRKCENSDTMIKNVRLLSDNGAAELADRGGMLPMHYACAYGSNADVLKVLPNFHPASIRETADKEI